jgi:hypothetical protein
LLRIPFFHFPHCVYEKTLYSRSSSFLIYFLFHNLTNHQEREKKNGQNIQSSCLLTWARLCVVSYRRRHSVMEWNPPTQRHTHTQNV